jgi:hypothetical protein
VENYQRHVREKNGRARIQCQFCIATFSRKSNRDNHISQMRCKVLRDLCNQALQDSGTNTSCPGDDGDTVDFWNSEELATILS